MLDHIPRGVQAPDPKRGERHLKLLGRPVCNRAFMMLLGVGTGRFSTLSSAARRGEEFCPYDGRFVPREKRNLQNLGRGFTLS